MTKSNVHLLIIDPQNDFCDLPTANCPVAPTAHLRIAPALPVTGAHADMQRLAALVDAGRDGLNGITITLDSHHHLDIAHPTFWQSTVGGAIAPFTPIRAAEVRAGQFVPRLADARERVLAYLDELEHAGRYTHMVWPVHCEIGTWGHAIHHDLHLACNRWEERHLRNVSLMMKGSNPWTEHFSAIKAEVPDPSDPSTGLNHDLLDRLRASDRVFIAGEAGSHCVKATTEHLVENFSPLEIRKLVLVEDCISAVGGFESNYCDFLNAMRGHGVQIAHADEVIAELQANAV